MPDLDAPIQWIEVTAVVECRQCLGTKIWAHFGGQYRCPGCDGEGVQREPLRMILRPDTDADGSLVIVVAPGEL